MGWIELVIIFVWTWAVAHAAYKIGYSEGHNDATIISAKSQLGLSEKTDEED